MPDFEEALTTDEITRSARYSKKYDGAIFANINDSGTAESIIANDYIAFSPNQAKSATDNNGDFSENLSILYELEQDDLETEAKKAIDQGMSKDDFIQKMLSQDATEFGLDDGTFDTSLKIAGITEAEKIAELNKAELNKAWQTANETAAKVDKELFPDETDEGNTDFNPDEYEAQLASAYDKVAEPPP
ncbi:MAG: hypothetical protein Ta2F_13400 [Termitinemataceae bacterium]|nr:MAG: hypothetical protein Ta2F_13400 [Termitinemataceae bacterium]